MAYPHLELLAIPFIIIGAVLITIYAHLANSGRKDRTTKSLLIASAVAFIVAISVVAGQLYWIYSDADAARHATLTYDVQLNINGTGVVKVALPLPMNERLFQNAHIQPESSIYALNRSGNETMMDVVMSENTSFHAQYYGLRSEVPIDLTETSDESMSCYESEDCTSVIEVTVLGGMVADVHVTMNVAWSTFCTSVGAYWSLDCYAIPGRYEYHGHWVPSPVC